MTTCAHPRALALASKLHDEMVRRGLTLATAESCTAGILAMVLTERSGSSRFYLGGVAAYSNHVKKDLLGVPEPLLREKGAVSGEVAKAMAVGIRRATGATWAVSLTGIAGPEGAVPGKPVGTVWCGLSGPQGDVARLFELKGNRHQVRWGAAEEALALVGEALFHEKPMSGV